MPITTKSSSQITGPDYARIKSKLNSSTTQSDNPALYESVKGLINGVKSYQDFANSQFTGINTSFNSFTDTFAAINNTLQQLAQGLIDAETAIAIIQSQIAVLENFVIGIVEVDTSTSPQTVVLADVVAAFTIIKDISGNAAVNNITLTGTVEGVANPVLNTNFISYHVYKTGSGAFLKW